MNRDKFEELCVEKFGQWREAGNRENDNGAPLTRESLCWRDENGNYGVLALNAAWWGYQAALREQMSYLRLLQGLMRGSEYSEDGRWGLLVAPREDAMNEVRCYLLHVTKHATPQVADLAHNILADCKVIR